MTVLIWKNKLDAGRQEVDWIDTQKNYLVSSNLFMVLDGHLQKKTGIFMADEFETVKRSTWKN